MAIKNEQSQDPYSRLDQATQKSRDRFLALPLVQRFLNPPATLSDKDRAEMLQVYTRFLVQSYYHVHAAYRVYCLAGARVPESDETIRRWLLQHSIEEQGHHEWILNDLAALGVDGKAIVEGYPEPPTSALVGFMYYIASNHNPIGILGDSYVIEGLSQLYATILAQNLEKMALPKDAVTYLARHGEADQAHMEHLRDLINKHVRTEQDLRDIIYVSNSEFEYYGWIIKSLGERA
jgi:pyrroloquinoline quinone (PQQ) biosynthesis protein C